MPKLDQKKFIAKALRKTLADNVTNLQGELSDRDVAARSNGRISYNLVMRVREQRAGISLDNLQALADALEVDPWNLLLAGYKKPVVIHRQDVRKHTTLDDSQRKERKTA